MSKIKKVIAYRVWDSRGRPTVEVEITLENGRCSRGIAPAGASRGTYEAIEIRDGGKALAGKDVKIAINSVNTKIAPALIGLDIREQRLIDSMLIELDGTTNRSNLGGNALVATSMAVLNTAAVDSNLPLWQYLSNGKTVKLPLPQIQIFGGGAHAGRQIDIQDLMIVAPSAKSFEEALEMTAEVYIAAGNIMAERNHIFGVADEGGWWPVFDSNEQALDTLVKSIERAGFTPGHEIAIVLDIASSEFGKNGRYHLALESVDMDSDAMCEKLINWIDKYPIVSIEDPLAEDDEKGLIAFTKAVGNRVQIVGDDYLVTNANKVRHAAKVGACNAVLLKPNQAGTITETLETFEAARSVNFSSIISARSGETEDITIVHLATGWNVGHLKVGSFARSERLAKWNEAVRVEKKYNLGFWGKSALKQFRF